MDPSYRRASVAGVPEDDHRPAAVNNMHRHPSLQQIPTFRHPDPHRPPHPYARSQSQVPGPYRSRPHVPTICACKSELCHEDKGIFDCPHGCNPNRKMCLMGLITHMIRKHLGAVQEVFTCPKCGYQGGQQDFIRHAYFGENFTEKRCMIFSKEMTLFFLLSNYGKAGTIVIDSLTEKIMKVVSSHYRQMYLASPASPLPQTEYEEQVMVNAKKAHWKKERQRIQTEAFIREHGEVANLLAREGLQMEPMEEPEDVEDPDQSPIYAPHIDPSYCYDNPIVPMGDGPVDMEPTSPQVNLWDEEEEIASSPEEPKQPRITAKDIAKNFTKAKVSVLNLAMPNLPVPNHPSTSKCNNGPVSYSRQAPVAVPEPAAEPVSDISQVDPRILNGTFFYKSLPPPPAPVCKERGESLTRTNSQATSRAESRSVSPEPRTPSPLPVPSKRPPTPLLVYSPHYEQYEDDEDPLEAEISRRCRAAQEACQEVDASGFEATNGSDTDSHDDSSHSSEAEEAQEAAAFECIASNGLDTDSHEDRTRWTPSPSGSIDPTPVPADCNGPDATLEEGDPSQGPEKAPGSLLTQDNSTNGRSPPPPRPPSQLSLSAVSSSHWTSPIKLESKLPENFQKYVNHGWKNVSPPVESHLETKVTLHLHAKEPILNKLDIFESGSNGSLDGRNGHETDHTGPPAKKPLIGPILPKLPPAVKKRPVTPALSPPHRRRSTRSRSSAASRHRTRTPRRSPSRSRERSRTPRRSPSRRRRRAKVSPRRSRSPRRTPQRSRTPKRSRSRSRSRSARRRSPSRRRDSTSKDKRRRRRSPSCVRSGRRRTPSYSEPHLVKETKLEVKKEKKTLMEAKGTQTAAAPPPVVPQKPESSSELSSPPPAPGEAAAQAPEPAETPFERLLKMARPYFSSVILPKPEADPIPEPSQPPARHQLPPDYPEYGPPPFKPRKRHDYEATNPDLSPENLCPLPKTKEDTSDPNWSCFGRRFN